MKVVRFPKAVLHLASFLVVGCIVWPLNAPLAQSPAARPPPAVDNNPPRLVRMTSEHETPEQRRLFLRERRLELEANPPRRVPPLPHQVVTPGANRTP